MGKKNNIQFLSGKNEEFDLRTNPFKEKGDDMNPTTDHVHIPEGPITRSKVKIHSLPIVKVYFGYMHVISCWIHIRNSRFILFHLFLIL